MVNGRSTTNCIQALNKYVVVSVIMLAISVNGFAQQMEWVKGIGGSANVNSIDIITDASGNVYTVGTFQSVVDFDPGMDEYLLTAFEPASVTQKEDVFVCKLDANGDFVWARQLGGHYKDAAAAVSVDIAGNVYVAGNFNTSGIPDGQMDADPGAGPADTFYLEGRGGFLTKLDSGGDFVWAKHWAGIVMLAGMDIDGDGNIYLGGNITGAIDADPGMGTSNTFSLTATASQKGFLVKLDSEGDFIWGKLTSHSNTPLVIEVSDVGNIYAAGSFNGTVDFDPGPDLLEMTATGVLNQYIYKLDTDGNLLWANRSEGQGGAGTYQRSTGMAIDEDENIYTVGYFKGVYDFDPDTSPANTHYLGNDDTARSYLLKLDSLGAFVWAHVDQYNGTSQFTSVAAKDRKVYVTGSIADSIDVDFGVGEHWLYRTASSGQNGADAFLLRLDAADGTFSWVAQHEADAVVRGGYIHLDSENNCYVAGEFTQAVTFDIFGNPIDLYPASPASWSDLYVLKYSCNSYTTIDTTACLLFSYHDTDYTESGTYEILLPNAVGCDSIITLNLTLQLFDTAIILEGDALVVQSGGLSYQWLDCDDDMAPIPGATDQSFSPEAVGTYAVTLTSGDCSYTTDCIVFEAGNKINELVGPPAVTVYPNPADNVLYVETITLLKGASITVRDITGRAVIQQLGVSGSEIRMDVSNLAPGIYLLDIIEDGLYYRFKWVKE